MNWDLIIRGGFEIFVAAGSYAIVTFTRSSRIKAIAIAIVILAGIIGVADILRGLSF